MLARSQIKVGDTTEALQTIARLRKAPGLEKAHAYIELARQSEEKGDLAGFEEMMARAQTVLEASVPVNTQPGRTMAMTGISRTTFVDFDLELSPALQKMTRNSMLKTVRARAVDVDDALRQAKTTPPEQRDGVLAGLATSFVDRGDLAHATELTLAITDHDTRLQAISTLAVSIPGRHRERKR